VTRRAQIVVGVVALAIAAGVAGGILLAFSGTSAAAPTKAEYFGNVAKICRSYGPKLDAVTPPQDVTIPGEVVTSLSRIIPVIRAETKAVRALPLPQKLAGEIRHWLALKDRTLAALEDALHQAEAPNIAGTAVAYIHFEQLARQTSKAGHEIGFPSICSSSA